MELFYLIIMELSLLYAAGISFFGGTRGIIGSAVLLSVINKLLHNIPDFTFWEIVIFCELILGISANYFIEKKTNLHQIFNISFGALSSIIIIGIFISLIPAFFIWLFLIGIPIIFTYKNPPIKWLYFHTLAKFILSLSWIIIGNIFY